MADHDLRDLERSALAGDAVAAAKLARLRWRAGRCPRCDGPVPERAPCCCFACWAPARAGRCQGCPREETP